MSRYVRGTASVGPEVAAKIIRALPEPHSAELLAAYLRDEIPPDLAHLVLLAPNTSKIAEESELLPSNLDNELRSLLIYFAKAAVTHPQIRDMLGTIRSALEAE